MTAPTLLNAGLPRLLLLLLLPLLALAGCGDPEPGLVTCEETSECAFGESCLNGVCTSRSCATSAGCPVGSFCGSGGECVAGCENTDDCYPDQVCNDGACSPRGCRDTSLDCAFGEFCDTITGECYAASGPYGEPCVAESTNPEQCGTAENVCLRFGQYGDFCGVECDNNTDCPAGFDCIPIGDSAGNVTTKQCITYCWLYDDDTARTTARPLPPSALDLDGDGTCTDDQSTLLPPAARPGGR